MLKMLQAVLILSLLLWVSGCSSTGGVNCKPDSALTLPMETYERDADDTPRSCVVKLLRSNNQIKDGNLRFQVIRE